MQSLFYFLSVYTFSPRSFKWSGKQSRIIASLCMRGSVFGDSGQFAGWGETQEVK